LNVVAAVRHVRYVWLNKATNFNEAVAGLGGEHCLCYTNEVNNVILVRQMIC